MSMEYFSKFTIFVIFILVEGLFFLRQDPEKIEKLVRK